MYINSTVHAHRLRQVAKCTAALLALARVGDAVTRRQLDTGDCRLHLILEVANQVAVTGADRDSGAAQAIDVVDGSRNARLFERGELTQFHNAAHTVHG
jgi:hypothetical protein